MITPSERPKVLVVGATGRTGRLISSRLATRGFAVRALVRNQETAGTQLSTDVELVVGDLQNGEAIASVVADVAIVVFAASAGAYAGGQPREVDFNGVARITDAALQSGVAYMVLMSSASVTHPEHPHNCTFNSVLKWKAEGERHLRASGLPYTVVRALGLRDRDGELQGVRMVQGDRLAFGEDIARADAAAFLCDVVSLGAPLVGAGGPAPLKLGFAPTFEASSMVGATLEIYNDASIPPGMRASEHNRLKPDRAPALSSLVPHV